MFNENETLAKYEIMDGAPVRGKNCMFHIEIKSVNCLMSDELRVVNSSIHIAKHGELQ